MFGLITFVGLVLCIVPGVILALMFSQFYFLILDRRLGVMDSLSYSNQIMQGNKLTLFAIILVTILLGAAVVVCTCGVGLLAVLPFLGLLYPVVYLAITAQPTADRLAAGMARP
ncbi:MAG: hypothetical protein GTO62_03225 [Planctomycetales bacterium]|nr:hypothetical protein [Planctomycetales bacterium]NIP68230.1 hypothetical protein [Planctomycetales bacterium]